VSDIVLGGLISLVSSLVTTIAISVIAFRRELRTRWDKDTLSIVSRSLVSSERAMGRIYAWSRGELSVSEGYSRPTSVDELVDLAYYQLEELAVLFPRIAERAHGLQTDLISLTELTKNASRKFTPASTDPEYLAGSESLREKIGAAIVELRSAAQKRLAIS
jgi:hypothetical protein